MKIGITGISAFVGYHLAKELVKKGEEVIGFSRSKGEIEKELNSSRFQFVSGDITDFHCLEDALKDTSLIYHLSAVSSERLCKGDVRRSFKVNVEGTINVLELARRNRIKVIYASSGAVYPPSSKAHCEEEAGFCGGFYAISKLTAEKYCELYHRNFDTPFVILRFSRIYGQGMKRNPIYDLFKAIKEKEEVKFYESLDSCYDFIYVKDVVKALLLAQGRDWENQIVNISSEKGILLKELVQEVEQIIGERLSVRVLEHKKSTDVLDNRKAESLGWRPEYSLKEGLKEMIGKQ